MPAHAASRGERVWMGVEPWKGDRIRGFMAPMHGAGVKVATHEPAYRSPVGRCRTALSPTGGERRGEGARVVCARLTGTGRVS